ncbi:MAG: hypothetical protein Q4C59_08505 [Lachnospiraceae bacterium]|nr:hypothetical protein [Lachnospiraceae bacterium]
MEKQLKRNEEKCSIMQEKTILLKIAGLLAQERIITPDERARLEAEIRQGGQF